MSTYLGNPSLSTAVKERVSSTFQQAVALYKLGRTDEVVQGCNLILQMDPSFDPARKLLEKTRNPNLPIDIDALIPASADDAMTEAHSAMAARDFQRVVNITTEILTNDLMNDDARILGDEAREKMEAGPFVEQFAKKCEQHISAGNIAAARQDLEKARSLDAGHPLVRRIEQMITSSPVAASQAAPPAAAAPPPAASGFNFDAQPQQPSFVVDTPKPAPSTTRPAAQATDFGFTFEEEKSAPPSDGGFSNFSFGEPAAPAPPPPASGGFSFDTPSTPQSGSFNFDSATAKAPASGDFDFSTAAIETSEDDKKKIDQYLADGDRAFDSGEYQQAIDLWSRIFLIDVTNDQASERIERAKVKRRDIEQKVEGIVAAGVAAFDRNDQETARAKFAEALRVDPTNSTAHDYMDRLANTVAEGGAVGVETPYVAPTAEKFDIFDDEASSGSYETPAPPEPAAATKKTAAKAAPKAAPKKKVSMLPVFAVLAVVLLGGGGWFVWSRMSHKSSFDPAATKAAFAEATAMAKRGQFDQAIAILQEIKPEDPQHDKAVVMIADMERKKSQGSALIDGKPAETYYQDQLTAGRTQFDAHDYDGAKKSFENATRVRPLPADVKAMYDNATQQTAKLDAAKALFKERRYQDAIANLQPLALQDPQNLNIRRMLIDAHFDMGAQALQEERLPDAMKEFDEVLKVDPTDDLAKRSKELAARYNGQTKDLLYKIYVKYLPLREVG
jgi:tetratricopeptide (TPR) repeat protein